jgi:hypothetical protein
MIGEEWFPVDWHIVPKRHVPGGYPAMEIKKEAIEQNSDLCSSWRFEQKSLHQENTCLIGMKSRKRLPSAEAGSRTAHLVDRPPQIVPFTTDREKHLVQVPFIPWPGTPVPELMGMGLPKLPAPIPHGFVRENDATCGHQFFGVPVTEAETKVQPDTVADDLCRKPMALIQGDWWSRVHAASMPCRPGAGQVRGLI